MVIDDGVAGAVKLRRQSFFRDGKAHGIGKTLTQWASGGFNAGRVAEFRVARGGRMQLAEILQLFQA